MNGKEKMLEQLVEEVREIAGDRDIRTTEKTKNNGGVETGISIEVGRSASGNALSAVVYVDDFLNAVFLEKLTYKEAAQKIISIAEKGKPSWIDGFELKLTKENIFSKVYRVLVNREKNAEQLKLLPHKEFLDLAIIYKYKVAEDEDLTGAITIDNNMLAILDATLEELDEAAQNNHPDYQIISTSKLIAEVTGIEADVEMGFPMMVVTTPNGLHGAASMTDGYTMKKLSAILGNTFYIFPSSVHEIIAVPCIAGEYDELRKLVREVNSTNVRAEDYLSDNVYKYENNQVTMIA